MNLHILVNWACLLIVFGTGCSESSMRGFDTGAVDSGRDTADGLDARIPDSGDSGNVDDAGDSNVDGGADARLPDARRGDAGVGTIACGDTTCEVGVETCCLGDGLGPHCIPRLGSCGYGIVECDDTGDCPSGVCCVTPGGFMAARCSEDYYCAFEAGEAEGCRTTDECALGDKLECCPLSYGGGYCNLRMPCK